MAVLPLIGAGLGAFEGYRRSEGNLGAALLGAGLGAATPFGIRMAGTALGGALGAGALGRASGALGQKALQANLAARAMKEAGAQGAARAAALGATAKLGGLASKIATPAGLGAVAAGLGTAIGLPALGGRIAGAAAGPATRGAGSAARLGAGALGYRTPEDIAYEALTGGAVPDVGTFGAGGTLSDPLSVLGPVGMARQLEMLKSAEAQRDAIRLLSPEIAKASEFAKKQDFQRSLAAAGVRQNILTAANMLERSQQAAQQMGVNAASQIGSALTQQYQYQ